MALITEDGTGIANAESYCSVADASAYHSARGNTTWATISTTEMEQALRRATDYIQQVYRSRWTGYRKTTTQALEWPRFNAPFVNGDYYSNTIVPVEVKNACAELAWKAAQGELAPDIEQKTKREKIGPMEVEYADYGLQYTQYRAIDNLLAPLLISTGGAFRQVVRS